LVEKMKSELQVVTTLPLRELWLRDGARTSSRMEWLSTEDIRDLLRAGPVTFVVADVGAPLRWIETKDYLQFWKSEIKQHLTNSSEKLFLNDFPDSYCYSASRWEGTGLRYPVVLLEKHH